MFLDLTFHIVLVPLPLLFSWPLNYLESPLGLGRELPVVTTLPKNKFELVVEKRILKDFYIPEESVGDRPLVWHNVPKPLARECRLLLDPFQVDRIFP